MIDERPLARRAEDSAPAPTAALDLQTLLIEQSELLTTIGSDVVQLLHALDTVGDLIEMKRRVRVWAEELHAHATPAMACHEAIGKEARSRGLLRAVYTDSRVGSR